MNRLGCLVRGAALVTVLVGVGLFLRYQTADISDVVRATHCADRLESLHAQLVKYGQSHEEFPLLDNAQIDIQAILNANGVSDFARFLCPDNPTFDCYVFREGLRPSDISDVWNSDTMMVIAADRPGNHVQRARHSDPNKQSIQLLHTNNCGVTTRTTTTLEAMKLVEMVRLGQDIFDYTK